MVNLESTLSVYLFLDILALVLLYFMMEEDKRNQKIPLSYMFAYTFLSLVGGYLFLPSLHFALLLGFFLSLWFCAWYCPNLQNSLGFGDLVVLIGTFGLLPGLLPFFFILFSMAILAVVLTAQGGQPVAAVPAFFYAFGICTFILALSYFIGMPRVL